MVYVDESGINTCLVREYGRAPCGEIVEGAVSGRKFQRLNVIGGYCNKEHLSIECYVYVADTYNQRIRKITPSGMVSTLAGDGTESFADGPGVSARFSTPFGVAVDNAGNVYAADTSNHRIRKISQE